MTATPNNELKKQYFSSQQRTAILEELEAVLSSSAFTGSKRSCEFLDFIVKRTLGGNLEHLTERLLGVNLFHRPIDYETATDAIVRVQACDVRRRLTRYNLDHPSSHGVTIKLAPGSYIPEFCWLDQQVPKEQESKYETIAYDNQEQLRNQIVLKTYHDAASIIRHFAKPLLLGSVLLALTAGILTALWWHVYWEPDHALNEFWKPVFASKGTADIRFGDYVCYGLSPELQHDVESHRASMNVAPSQIVESKNASISSGSLQTAISISSLLERHGIITRLQLPQDFQNNVTPTPHSIIYIGAFNNPWTMEMNRNLRFSFVKKADKEWAIVDQNQAERIWSTNPYSMNRDYALITRIFDKQHKQILISVGAVSQYGTQAAGKFLTDGNAFGAFERTTKPGWERKNLQIVLSMDISEGRVIDPKIIATNIW